MPPIVVTVLGFAFMFALLVLVHHLARRLFSPQLLAVAAGAWAGYLICAQGFFAAIVERNGVPMGGAAAIAAGAPVFTMVERVRELTGPNCFPLRRGRLVCLAAVGADRVGAEEAQ